MKMRQTLNVKFVRARPAPARASGVKIVRVKSNVKHSKV